MRERRPPKSWSISADYKCRFIDQSCNCGALCMVCACFVKGPFVKGSLIGALSEFPGEASVLLVLTIAALWAARKLFLSQG